MQGLCGAAGRDLRRSLRSARKDGRKTIFAGLRGARLRPARLLAKSPPLSHASARGTSGPAASEGDGTIPPPFSEHTLCRCARGSPTAPAVVAVRSRPDCDFVRSRVSPEPPPCGGLKVSPLTGSTLSLRRLRVPLGTRTELHRHGGTIGRSRRSMLATEQASTAGGSSLTRMASHSHCLRHESARMLSAQRHRFREKPSVRRPSGSAASGGWAPTEKSKHPASGRDQ